MVTVRAPDDEVEFDDEEDVETCESLQLNERQDAHPCVDEETRRRRILENQWLLDSLGIQATPTSSSLRTQPSTSKRRKRDVSHKTVYDRSGFIISQPGPSEIHRMACVEMPSDRKLLRRIAEGGYQDYTHWREGEERRWRFGHGRGGNLAVGDEELVGEVGEDFRWRRWSGSNKALRREMRKRGELNERDARPATPVQQTTEGVSAYSLIPGETCHQCRRKSEKRKMKCRNVDPVCRAVFCETCCKRYSYFEFDPESRSFICPLCKDCCNCSNCIRKRNLAHLLGPTGKGIRTKSLSVRIRKETNEAITVQAWLEKAVEDRVGVPFDRVRLVDQATDVISPELPPDETQVPQTTPKGKKKRKLAGSREGGTKAKKKRTEQTDLVVKLKLPPDLSAPEQRPSKVKEVDSDGDTVGGWSTDDDGPAKAASSSFSSLTPSPFERRLAFPPRPSVVTPNINDYLSRLANPAQDTDPALAYPTFESFSTMQIQSFSVNGRLASLQPESSPALSTEDLAGPLISQNDALLDLQPSEANESRAPQSMLVPDPPRATITDAGSVAWQPVAGTAQASFLTQHQSTYSTETFDSLALPTVEYDNHPSYGYETYPYSQTSSLESAALGGSSHISLLPLHNQPPPYSHTPPAQAHSGSASIHRSQQSTSTLPHDSALNYPGESELYHPVRGPDASGAHRQQGASAQNLDLLSLAAAEARQSPNLEDRGYPTRHPKSSVVPQSQLNHGKGVINSVYFG
ncbi:hypothetical protein BCR39DRAFT_517877 [Naematelia encephala]|uniref:Zinc-finger domain-containing protein n=1 Tax=Naematelia encephala TaxID=71784 RepID=A0A1Y2BHT4_9TREE|nr:hypothetical protein BCR39DRAFT_517877 [Naematelia encephala]